MPDLEGIPAPAGFEWIPFLTFVTRKEQMLAGALKRMAPDMARQSLIRGDVPFRYRDTEGQMHSGSDLPRDFLAEAEIDLVRASATRLARVVREPNPYYPFARGDNPHPIVTWSSDQRSHHEFVDRVEPAVTIHAIEVLVPATESAAIAEQAVQAEIPPGPQDTGRWLADEVQRRIALGNIPEGRGAITQFSKELAAQMAEDARAGRCVRGLMPRRIENLLREYGLWPINSLPPPP